MDDMKRKIIVIVFLLSIHLSYSQNVNWVSMDEAQELIKQEPRKIIMDVYTSWCGPCKMLDKYTFGNPDVANYINENFYAVKFNAEGNSTVNFNNSTFTNPDYNPAKASRRNSKHQFANYLNVKAYPTIIFMGADLKLLAPITGYLSPQKIEIYLKFFKTDAYKDVNSEEDWEKYQEEFVHQFDGK